MRPLTHQGTAATCLRLPRLIAGFAAATPMAASSFSLSPHPQPSSVPAAAQWVTFGFYSEQARPACR